MNHSNTNKTEERRSYPRHMTDLRVQLLRRDRLPMLVHTVELSLGGMHIESDRAQAQLLAPPDTRESQEFTARISLSAPGVERRVLTLNVVVSSSVELGEDRYRVGLCFLNFFGKSRESLADFISALEA
jgi:hypothetical protein